MPFRPVEMFRSTCSYAKCPCSVKHLSFLASRFCMSSSSCFHAAVRMFFLAALSTDFPSPLFPTWNLQRARKVSQTGHVSLCVLQHLPWVLKPFIFLNLHPWALRCFQPQGPVLCSYTQSGFGFVGLSKGRLS